MRAMPFALQRNPALFTSNEGSNARTCRDWPPRRLPSAPAFPTAKVGFSPRLASMQPSAGMARKLSIAFAVKTSHVFGVRSAQHQIVNGIIRRIVVLMVNNFTWKQFASEMSLHDQPISGPLVAFGPYIDAILPAHGIIVASI